MTPRQFYDTKSKEDVRSVATAAETTFNNFQQIALAGGSCSKSLAEKLSLASDGEMTEIEILYPERFSEPNGEQSVA